MWDKLTPGTKRIAIICGTAFGMYLIYAAGQAGVLGETIKWIIGKF